MSRRLTAPALRAAIAALVAVGVWQLLSGSQAIPAPLAVLDDLAAHRDVYGPHAWVTLREAALGYLWGNSLAILLAMAVVLVPILRDVVVRLTLLVYMMPILVVAPILQVVFVGIFPVVIMSGLFVVFTTFVAALVGLSQADSSSLAVVRVAGGTRLDELRKVRLKAWLPSLFGGLAIAAPLSVVGAMVGEYMGSTSGLGIAMVQAQSAFAVERVWGLALVAGALSLTGYVVASAAGRLATPWARDRLSIATVQSLDVHVSGSLRRRVLAGIGLAALAAALAIGGWMAFVRGLALDPFFAKTPADVWAYLVSGADAGAHRAELADALGVTLLHAGVGFVAGFAVGVAIACLIQLLPRLEQGLSPFLVALSSVPVAAMIPLIATVVDNGIAAVGVVVALLTFFPTFVNSLIGLRSAPQQARELVAVSGGGALRALWTVQLRFALPSLFASARIAVPGAIGGAIVAEWLITGDGLALLMESARGTADFTMLWAAGVVAGLCSLVIYGAIASFERTALRRWGSVV